MKGGRIPIYTDNFFAFNGSHNVIFKENYIYKTPVQDAPTIVLDNQTFDYRESQPGEIETANANYEKEQTYNTNFKDCEVLKNDNAEIVLDYISIFDKLESDNEFIKKYGNLGMDSIFKNILNCIESNSKEHLEFIKSLKKIFKISNPEGQPYIVGGLTGKYNLFSKYSFIDELKTLIIILMGDTNDGNQIESMLLGNRIHGGIPNRFYSEDDIGIRPIKNIYTNRTRKLPPKIVKKSQTRYENEQKYAAINKEKQKNAKKTQKTKQELTPQQQRFVNICDFMKVTHVYTEAKEPTVWVPEYKKLSKAEQEQIDDKIKNMTYEEYITNTYEKHIHEKTDLREYEQYMAAEIKEILDLKTTVFDYLKKTPLQFNLLSRTELRYRDPNIAKEIGIDLGSFIFLYYIKLRFNKPSLEMNNRVIGIEPLYPLYPISKKLFIDTLIGKENIPIIQNVVTGFDILIYPKIEKYGVKSMFSATGRYSECAGRGLFEIVKFIALGEDNQFHSEYFPDKTLDSVKELFNNEKYNTFEKMGMNEADAFSEFMDIMNDKKEFGLNYVRDLNGNEKNYELEPLKMNSYLNYVFNGAKQYNNSEPEIKHHSPVEIKITFDKNDIILENPYIILKLANTYGHTETSYKIKSDNNISMKNVEFANNMYLRFLVFKDVKIGTLNSKKITNMHSMFSTSSNLITNLSDLDVSNVKIMATMFSDCAWLNQPLNWDVSNVTNMGHMFSGCTTFNQPLNWDVSNVTNMGSMFYQCENFNQPLNWDVSKVTNMSSMFYQCENFNQPLNWDVSKVTNMSSMFYQCENFNQPLGYVDDTHPGWDVSNVTDMSSMFNKCSSFDQPLNSWNVSNVTNMNHMFCFCTSFNQPLNSWNVSNVTNMNSMFCFCTSFNQPLNDWDVSNVTNMGVMFENCNDFNQPLNNWNVSNATIMGMMFSGCTKFNQPLNSWNVSNVTNMFRMFQGCTNFNQPLNSWNVFNVQKHTGMFNDCPIESSNMPKFNKTGGYKFTKRAKQLHKYTRRYRKK